MQNAFCVILSKYRLYQGITLYLSLSYNYNNFVMFILCVDNEAYEICNRLNLENVILMRIDELNDSRLIGIRQSRRLNEYCWTLKPLFIRHVLNKYKFTNNVVYLDADICFFNDPSPIFINEGDYSVLLSEHDFLEKDRGVAHICGKYNSGFMVFRRSSTSMDILKWWADRCLEWCKDTAEDGKFGDQKYLDLMPEMFPGVKSITTPGVNIAPWNEDKYNFYVKDGRVFVNNDKLICYHFSGLRLIDKSTFTLVIGKQKFNSVIHTPYTKVLQEVISKIEQLYPGFDGYYVEDHFRHNAKLFRMGF